MSLSLDLPTSSDISALSGNSVSISVLQEMSLSSIQATDVFTIVDDYAETNFNVEKEKFDETILGRLFSDQLNISGDWIFGNVDGSSLSIDSKSLPETPDGNHLQVINKEYFETNILAKIDDLSSYLFGKSPHVPSYVGQIIASTTLSTSSDVIAVYGGEEWKPLTNRMILGQGKAQANNIETKYGVYGGGNNYPEVGDPSLGGSFTVDLTLNHIVSHTHRFVGQSIPFHMEWHYKGSEEANSIATATKLNDDNGHAVGGGWKKVTLGSLGILKIEGESDISTAKVFSKKRLDLSNGIYDPKSGSRMGHKAHNNIPPVMFAYIWTRTR